MPNRGPQKFLGRRQLECLTTERLRALHKSVRPRLYRVAGELGADGRFEGVIDISDVRPSYRAEYLMLMELHKELSTYVDLIKEVLATRPHLLRKAPDAETVQGSKSGKTQRPRFRLGS